MVLAIGAAVVGDEASLKPLLNVAGLAATVAILAGVGCISRSRSCRGV
jgi:hypothetical protein